MEILFPQSEKNHIDDENFINELLELLKPDRWIKIVLDSDKRKYEYTESAIPPRLTSIIHTNKNDSFTEIISDKESFNQAVKDYHEVLEYDYDKFYEENYRVVVLGNQEDIIHFINNNNLGSDRIAVSQIHSNISITDEEFVDSIMKEIKDLDNIYVITDENDSIVKIKDYKETINYINKIADKIKSLNLSPLEQTMYIYDIVRDREYKEEEKYDDYTKSRDLTAITSGEEIVCIGYARIFNAILKKLGFKSRIQIVEKKDHKECHAREMIYIKDEKYNIDCILTFDPTFDSKKGNNNDHFNKYVFFGKTNDFFEFTDNMLETDYYSEEMESVEKVFCNVCDFDTVTKEDLIRVNELYKDFFNDNLIKQYEIDNKDNLTEDEIMKLIDRHINFYYLLHGGISREKFIELLTTVRIQEHMDNPTKFPLSTDKILEITRNSISTEPSIKEARAIAKGRLVFKTPEDYIKEQETEKRISGVQLVKTLRKVLEKKTNE